MFHRVDLLRNLNLNSMDDISCIDVPVYEQARGGAWLVQPRGEQSWYVLPSESFGKCNYVDQDGSYWYYQSRPNSQARPRALPPDAAGYGWSDPGGYQWSSDTGTIHIVAGGGGGEGR